MRDRDALLIGAIVGAGALLGARAWRRSQRRIDLTDRVVLITGASSGHGLILAQLAAERGARLVLAARSLDALDEARPELLRLGARDVLNVATDVRDEGQVRSMIDQAIARHGRIDVLINNAGLIQVGPVDAMTVDDFRDAMATNYWGAVYASLAVLPHMKAQKFGRIGNVSSVGGKLAVPHLLPYTASKFALTGFTEGLRAELAGENILVTGLYPATMRTGGHAHAQFKGNQESEYAWFALGDSIPGLASSAETVARKFLAGICNGDPQVVVGLQTHLAVLFHNLLPDETAELSSLVDRFLLPGSTGLPTASIRGDALSGTLPGLLNRVIPSGTRPGSA